MLAFGNLGAEEALIEGEGIFTGQTFEDLVAADVPEVVADPGDDEGAVVLAAWVLQDALTCAEEQRLVEVSRLRVTARSADGAVFDEGTAVRILKRSGRPGPRHRPEAGGPVLLDGVDR